MTAKLEPTPGPHSPSNPRYPSVQVRLTGTDSNAFSVMGLCSRVARKAGVSDAEVKGFLHEAMAGDYDGLLQTCLRWWDVS
jgi:hypothetical protein